MSNEAENNPGHSGEGIKHQLSDADTSKYCREGGTKCPFCASDDIEGTQVEIDAGYASQEVSCPNCSASWTDVYQLVDLNITELPLGSGSTPESEKTGQRQ